MSSHQQLMVAGNCLSPGKVEYLLQEPDDSMLSLDDKHVVTSDPDLPALRLFLDDEAALEWFQEHFPQLQPTAARCTYLRYKPQTSCLAAYTLETRHGERLFYGKAYPQVNCEKFKKVIDSKDRLALGETCSLVSQKLSVVFKAFPLDDELPALQQLFGGDTDKPLLSRLAPEQQELHEARVVTLRYKPERRFVARLDVADKPAALLKIHTESRYQQARRAVKSLGPLDRFSTAQAIGHSDKYHSLLVSWLPGKSLSSAIESGQATPCATLEACGRAIAKLHNLQTAKLATRSKDDEIRAVIQQTKDFSYVQESLAAKYHRLSKQCTNAIPERLSTSVPTHGDFHVGQLLVDGKRVSVVDLDNVAQGYAAYDLGNFIASLERANLLGTIGEDEKERFVAAFLDGYQRETKDFIDHRAVRIYAVSGLLRLIHEPFRHRTPDWQNQQETMLERADAILAEVGVKSVARNTDCKSAFPSSKSHRRVDVVDPFDAREDETLPFLADSLDPSLARETVGNLVQQVYDESSLDLRLIRVLRHKPGRRCLIAYQFQHGQHQRQFTVLGKVHAKSRHKRSYRLQRALWSSGFDDQSEDGISVARPLGILPQWNMWLQEHVLGQNGWKALLGTKSDTVATRIADAAHKLHQTEILTERVHTLDDELRILEEGLQKVIGKIPRLKSRIVSVLDACRELATSLSPAMLSPKMSSQTGNSGIHRDYYPDQILVSNDRIWILDHDLYCRGHPSLDIGNFCAHLEEKGLRQTENSLAFQTAGRQIQERFLALSGEGCDLDAYTLDAYTTLSLVRHIYLSTCFTNREFATLSILSACEQRLFVS